MIEDLNLLQVMDLSVQFDTYHGRVEAIDEANLTIKKGEVIGLVGESGCGKTTMARAVLNVIPSPPGKISQGQILFQGNNLLLMEEKELNSSIRGKAITLIPSGPARFFQPPVFNRNAITGYCRQKIRKATRISEVEGSSKGNRA